MKKYRILSLGIIIIPIIFLLSFANASESVKVTVTKDGEPIETVNVGDILTLHSELDTATEGNSVTFTINPEQLEYVDSPGETDLTVDMVQQNELWVSETQVKVLTPGAIEVSGTTDRGTEATGIQAYATPESINVSSTDFKPGEDLTLSASLLPEGETDPNLAANIIWTIDPASVAAKEQLTGETVTLTIPEDLDTLTVTASLPAYELSGQIILNRTQPLEKTLEILSSDNSPGIVKDNTLIFTAQGYSDSEMVISDYQWTAFLNEQPVEGELSENTYKLTPTESGNLRISCTATTDTGEVLSAEINKQIVDQQIPLEAIEITPSTDSNLQIGETIDFTTTYIPENATNIEGASFVWRVFENDLPVDTGVTLDRLSYTPHSAGTLSVKLDLITLNSDTVSSNTVTENVTLTDPGENQLKLISAKIVPVSDISNLVVGNNVILSSEISTEGTEGQPTYDWEAKTGNEIIATAQTEQFEFTCSQSAFVTVVLQVKVNEGLEDFQSVRTEYYLTFLPETVQQTDAKTVLDNIKSAGDTPATQLSQPEPVAEEQAHPVEEQPQNTDVVETTENHNSDLLTTGKTAVERLASPLTNTTGIINPVNNTEFTLGEVLLGLAIILFIIIISIILIIRIMRGNRKLFY